MVFDKRRVYTAANADELEVGSQIIVANDIATLKSVLQTGPIRILEMIKSKFYCKRFVTNVGDWTLAYLIGPPKKKVSKKDFLKAFDTMRDYIESNSAEFSIEEVVC